MRWHPDKNPDKAEEALAVFQDVGEAYTVTISRRRRSSTSTAMKPRGRRPDDTGGYQGGWTYTKMRARSSRSFLGRITFAGLWVWF